jgi:hypothetical protein
VAKLREMSGEAKRDGWRSWERWVTKLREMVAKPREMGGKAKRDGWRSWERWVANLREIVTKQREIGEYEYEEWWVAKLMEMHGWRLREMSGETKQDGWGS